MKEYLYVVLINNEEYMNAFVLDEDGDPLVGSLFHVTTKVDLLARFYPREWYTIMKLVEVSNEIH